MVAPGLENRVQSAGAFVCQGPFHWCGIVKLLIDIGCYLHAMKDLKAQKAVAFIRKGLQVLQREFMI